MTSTATAQPLLSIVVLVYNTGEYLTECFNSLLFQNYKNIEIIAVDDESTDDSLEICREYERNHGNFRCIHKKNEGGAVAGNIGVSLAQGEYVAIVDSDDIVTLDGYSRLMCEAIRHNADITIGRAERLVDGVIKPVTAAAERSVWAVQRQITNIKEFPDLVHDCFYWNKVFKASFLRKHSLGMVPGLLYADRPFVHKAYFYSEKTIVIPDLVYLWRRRTASSQVSISQDKAGIQNYQDRIHSMRLEWQDFENMPEAAWYRSLIAIHNLERALFPVREITQSPAFRACLFNELQALLSLYGDINTESLGNLQNLYLELIRKGYACELCYLLGHGAKGSIKEQNDSLYWALPYFENASLDIDPDIYRIKYPSAKSIEVSLTTFSDDDVYVEFTAHRSIAETSRLSLCLRSRLDGKSYSFSPIELITGDRYRSRIALSEIRKNFEGKATFDFYFEYYSGDMRKSLRIVKSMLMTDSINRPQSSTTPSNRLYITRQALGLALELSGQQTD